MKIQYVKRLILVIVCIAISNIGSAQKLGSDIFKASVDLFTMYDYKFDQWVPRPTIKINATIVLKVLPKSNVVIVYPYGESHEERIMYQVIKGPVITSHYYGDVKMKLHIYEAVDENGIMREISFEVVDQSVLSSVKNKNFCIIEIMSPVTRASYWGELTK